MYMDTYENEEELEYDNYDIEYISDEEREKCRKVVSAYEEEFEKMDMLVLEAGKYGFYKLLFSIFPIDVVNATLFTSAKELFDDLWIEWMKEQLITLLKDTPMIELSYDEMFESLSKDTQRELMAKRDYFAQKAGIF